MNNLIIKSEYSDLIIILPYIFEKQNEYLITNNDKEVYYFSTRNEEIFKLKNCNYLGKYQILNTCNFVDNPFSNIKINNKNHQRLHGGEVYTIDNLYFAKIKNYLYCSDSEFYNKSFINIKRKPKCLNKLNNYVFHDIFGYKNKNSNYKDNTIYVSNSLMIDVNVQFLNINLLPDKFDFNFFKNFYNFTNEEKENYYKIKKEREEELRKRQIDLELKKSLPKHCNYCGNPTQSYVKNPYDYDMNNNINYEWICNYCYDSLCGDI